MEKVKGKSIRPETSGDTEEIKREKTINEVFKNNFLFKNILHLKIISNTSTGTLEAKEEKTNKSRGH